MGWLLALLGLAVVAALAILLYLFLKKLKTSALHTHHPALGGFSVWCFQGGAWSLMEDNSAPGFVRGPPPAAPGLYDGYCMKVASVPDARTP